MEACTPRMLLGPTQSFSGSSRDGIHGFYIPRGSGFLDDSHLTYYNHGLSITCGGKKKDSMIVISKATMKKKLKLLKGLSTDLSLYTKIAADVDPNNALLSDLGQVLMSQLEQVKEEKKELKRKRKALKMKSSEKDSSSSSSDSSDSECELVVSDMNRIRSSACAQPALDYACQIIEPEETAVANSSMKLVEGDAMLDCLNFLAEELEKIELSDGDDIATGSKQECCTSAVAESVVIGRIDVCMGGKCKKFGAAELLDELQKKIGVEGAVVGCKCMGKCRNAPNVRVSNDSITAPNNSTSISGVGLEDVDTIASGFLGEKRKYAGSMAAA